MESSGTMINSWELGERFLKQDYEGDAVEGPFPSFRGSGFWGFNKATKEFEGFWIDTASTVMQVESGQVDAAGREWNMTGEMTCVQTGDTFKKRTVIKLIDDDHHSLEAYFTGPDGNEMKAMEIQYERVS
jgi:hypothetical protein